MPWTGKTFRRHNKGLSKQELVVAASIANAVLERTGDEGKAIRVANAQVKGKGRWRRRR
jgi:uncharacterized protein YdaT